LRRVLVDYVRRFRSEKPGGGNVCATLFDADNAV
jgi:RNA polymerase sigma factor (TIGR02999 family)